MIAQWNPFKKFFEEEDDAPDEDALAECHQIVDFSGHPFFEKFLAYLTLEADQPVDMTDPIAMTRSVARMNTFKEIKRHLLRQKAMAVETIARERRQ